jgi:hypothetical protein
VSGIPGTYRNEQPSEVLEPRFFPPGTVGITAGELSRFTSFSHAMYGVTANLPPGSGVHTQCGADICGNLNTICRRAEQFDGDWLWIMGDDHVFPGDILLRLLADMYGEDLDIVVPHCLKRNPGREPVVFSHRDDEGWLHVAELPERGLTKVHAAGSAGMLIRRRVLDAVGDPWFTPSAIGLAEDVLFCEKANALGFEVVCDPDILLGHTSIHTVWPSFKDGRWHVDLIHDHRETVFMRRIHEDFDLVQKLEPMTKEVTA